MNVNAYLERKKRQQQQQEVLPAFEIDYQFGVIYVIAFDHGEISLLGGTSLGWNDGYRAWSKSQIPIDYVQLPLGELWYPQLLFVSTIRKRSLKMFEPEDLAQIYSKGYVSLIRRNVFEGHCRVDYLRFPFDLQICQIQFSLERFFDPNSDPGFDVELVERDESRVGTLRMVRERAVGPRASHARDSQLHVPQDPTQSQKPEPRSNNNDMFMTGFVVNVTLRRRPQFYVVNILVPVLVLSVIGQMAFAVPAHSDAKIAVPLTVLLGFMFVQGIVATELPRSEGYPLLAVFILACEVLTGLNCVLCAVCMWLALNGLRVSLRVSRVLLRASSFLLLSHAPPAPSHRKQHADYVSTANRPEDPPMNHVNIDAVPRNHCALNSSAEAANNVQQPQKQPRAERSNETCGETSRLLTEPLVVEAGEVLARLLNRVLALFHLAAIALLFVSLILVPLIILQ